jgi:hypothetical protein
MAGFLFGGIASTSAHSFAGMPPDGEFSSAEPFRLAFRWEAWGE